MSDEYSWLVKWVSNHDPKLRGRLLERYRTRFDATEAANVANHVYSGVLHHWASKSEGEGVQARRYG